MQSAIRGPITHLTKRGIATAALLIATSVASAESTINASFSGSTFGDWRVNCIPLETSGGLECALSQRIDFEDSSEPLLKIDLYLNPRNSSPEAVMILPLGIPLSDKPILSFNNSNNISLKVSHCHVDGCYFKTPLSNSLLETFLGMKSGQLKLSGNNNETIEIPISGKGSRAAYNYFEALPKD